MKVFSVFVLIIAVISIGCTVESGVPTEFASACSAENDKKVIEVAGFLEPRKFMYCSNRSGRMECGFDLKESLGSEKVVRVEIEQGDSANMASKLESGFKPEDVKIRDNAGSVISISEKVRVTGTMSIVPAVQGSDGVCFMQVSKIER